VMLWLAENCIIAPHARVQALVAYRDYQKWIEARGAKAMSQMAFSRKLTERGFAKRKISAVYFDGLGLRADDIGLSAAGGGTAIAGGDAGDDAF
jgi:hypothetical protein